MTTQAMVLLVIAIVAVAAAVILALALQRTRKLKQRFGPEYDRAVREAGGTMRGESNLVKRERRVSKLHIRRLTPEEAARFSANWRRVQERFVDDPSAAVGQADQLIHQALSTCGYPVTDFERQVEDLSVDHAGAIQRYRQAHNLVTKSQPATEDLRVAMQHYRALFEDLMETGSMKPEEVRR